MLKQIFKNRLLGMYEYSLDVGKEHVYVEYSECSHNRLYYNVIFNKLSIGRIGIPFNMPEGRQFLYVESRVLKLLNKYIDSLETLRNKL